MSRTLKEATLQRYYYESHQQLRQHLANFLAAIISPGGSKPSAAWHPNMSAKSQ
jgi:hypothetical protein